MIGEKMQKAMNQQIKNELESAYLYLAMAADFHAKGLDGMAQWMRIQTLEEMTHAQKFYDHLIERDGRVELLPLNILKNHWENPMQAFQEAYKHEQFITGTINDLVALAMSEKDFAANAMLQWFVTEQVEEESNTSKVAQQLELVGGKGDALLLLDRELGTRTFVMPASPGQAGATA